MARAAGNGLYEPFPGPVPKQRAQHYVSGIARAVTPAALERGVFVGGFGAGATQPATGAAPASERAGRLARAPSPGWWQAALALAAGAMLAGVSARRVRSPLR